MAVARRLGVIAGGGDLPRKILAACDRRGEDAFVVRIKGAADEELGGDHGVTCSIGEIGRVIKSLKDAQCDRATFAGLVPRPDFSSVKLDWRGAKLLPKVISAARTGDGAILRLLADELESEGVHVIGAEDAAGELLVETGALGAHTPAERDRLDMTKAYALLEALGPFDVGQGAIVADGFVLAVEAAEGTDAMLERCASLPQRIGLASPAGVLLKAPKPQQDLRVDLPVIGPETVKRAVAAKLRGISVEAGRALIIDREETRRSADAAGIFIYGFNASDLAQP